MRVAWGRPRVGAERRRPAWRDLDRLGAGLDTLGGDARAPLDR
jgi:hypothetical protein